MDKKTDFWRNPKKKRHDVESDDFDWDWRDSNYRRAIGTIKETDSEFIIEVELPGIEREDIILEVNGNNLLIKAERKRHEITESSETYSFESSFSGFARAVSLPEEADLSTALVDYRNGLLTIIISKYPTSTSRKSRK